MSLTAMPNAEDAPQSSLWEREALVCLLCCVFSAEDQTQGPIHTRLLSGTTQPIKSDSLILDKPLVFISRRGLVEGSF